MRSKRSRAAQKLVNEAFLHRIAMLDIVDRLETINRSFENALFWGASGFQKLLTEKAGVKRIISVDRSVECLKLESDALYRIVADEEALPFGDEKFDLVVCLLVFHQTNDLVGSLMQVKHSLKPDGLFIGVLFGEETLSALRKLLYQAEADILGGVTPRVSPFASVRDLGAVLQRVGFALPVADIDQISVNYKDPKRLFADLRSMGETNALRQRKHVLDRRVAKQVLDELQRVNPTINFDLITLTGWAPAPSQPKPLEPGAKSRSMEKAIRDQL
ncbi:MAG: methyltransferase domain-containing protein [Pseudomonadota bacterium]